LLLPRITNASTISLDPGTPIVINHGGISIVNRSYDEIPLTDRDTGVDNDEVERALDVLCQYYPRAIDCRDLVRPIACLKPHINHDDSTIRHSVSEVVYEPRPGHIFALPGKMTEAPYVAATIVRGAADKLNLNSVTMRPLDKLRAQNGSLSIPA
jgi:hypothetical protein